VKKNGSAKALPFFFFALLK